MLEAWTPRVRTGHAEGLAIVAQTLPAFVRDRKLDVINIEKENALTTAAQMHSEIGTQA